MTILKALAVSLLLFINLVYGATVTIPTYDADQWYRNSAERIALYREIFYLALETVRIEYVTQHLKLHQWGVVLDIDETVLDNSAWDKAHGYSSGDLSQDEFAKEGISLATPGIKEFTQAVHALGGYVNFVSNRPVSWLAVTERNLRQQGIYFDQILLGLNGPGPALVNKDARFEAIAEGKSPSNLPGQNIIIFLGDNIQDFPTLKQKTMIKQDPNGSAYAIFGKKYFILPNPMYGSWKENRA